MLTKVGAIKYVFICHKEWSRGLWPIGLRLSFMLRASQREVKLLDVAFEFGSVEWQDVTNTQRTAGLYQHTSPLLHKTHMFHLWYSTEQRIKAPHEWTALTVGVRDWLDGGSPNSDHLSPHVRETHDFQKSHASLFASNHADKRGAKEAETQSLQVTRFPGQCILAPGDMPCNWELSLLSPCFRPKGLFLPRTVQIMRFN